MIRNRDLAEKTGKNSRCCHKCHKPSANKLCKTCERVQFHHDAVDASRVQKLRDAGWVPPEVETIRNKR